MSPADDYDNQLIAREQANRGVHLRRARTNLDEVEGIADTLGAHSVDRAWLLLEASKARIALAGDLRWD